MALTCLLILIFLALCRQSLTEESDADCFLRKNREYARLFKDTNNFEKVLVTAINGTKTIKPTYITIPREKRCWNHNDVLNVSVPMKIFQNRMNSNKPTGLYRNITTLFHYNRALLRDLLTILQNSVEIVSVKDNLPEMYDFIRYGKYYKTEPFLNQHSPELWIPFILQYHKYSSRILHTKVHRKNGVLPLFYYLDAHVFTHGLFVGNEDRVLQNNIYVYWLKIALYIYKIKLMRSANGFDVIIPATHPMTPLNIGDDAVKLVSLAQATFLVTDHDMKSRYAKDIIVPYFAGYDEDTVKLSSNTSKDIFLFFAGSPSSDLRVRVIELFTGANIKVLDKTARKVEKNVPYIGNSLSQSIVVASKSMSTAEFFKILYRSKFCLILRGDTTSSSRFFLSINAGCIPIIVSDWIILPYEKIIDYSKFTIQVEESFLLNEPLLFMDLLQSISNKTIQDMQRNLLLARELLSYDSLQELNPVSLMFMDALIHRIHYCVRIFSNMHMPIDLNLTNTATTHANDQDSLCNRIKSRIYGRLNINIIEFYQRLISISMFRKKSPGMNSFQRYPQ